MEGLRSGTNYRVRVQAANNQGNVGPKSNLLCAVTRDAKPDAPINLTEETKNKDATHLGLSWTEGAHDGGLDVTSYVVSWGSQ